MEHLVHNEEQIHLWLKKINADLPSAQEQQVKANTGLGFRFEKGNSNSLRSDGNAW